MPTDQLTVAANRPKGVQLLRAPRLFKCGSKGIVRKIAPTDAAEQAMAAEIVAAFNGFKEQIPTSLIAEHINNGTPMLMAQSLDWENGWVQPLNSAIPGNMTYQMGKAAEDVIGTLGASAGALSISVTNPEVVKFLETYGFGLVQDMAWGTKEMIQTAMLTAYQQGMGIEQAANMMRAHIGMNRPQQRAYDRYLERLFDRPGSGKSKSIALKRYEQRLIRQRCRMIARTELNRASNTGELIAWREAANNDYIDRTKTKKHWLSFIDERTSEYCETHDGDTVFLDDPFDEGFDGPPAHPNCRSSIWVEYVMKDPTKDPKGPEPGEGYTPAKYKDIDQWQNSQLYKDWQTAGPRGRSQWEVGPMDAEGMYRRHGDNVLSQIQQEQGFNGKATLISKEQMAAREAAGKRISYRGLEKANQYDAYLYGENYGGSGILGNGTYSAGQRTVDDAAKYLINISDPERIAQTVADSVGEAQRTASLYARSKDFMKMSIDDGARMIDYEDMKMLHHELRTKVASERSMLGGIGQTSPEAIARRDFLQFVQDEILYDEGRTAAALGYDGVIHNETMYLITQNRTATIVQEELMHFMQNP